MDLCPYQGGTGRWWHLYADGAFIEGHGEKAALAVVTWAELEQQDQASQGPLSFYGRVGAKATEALHESLCGGGFGATTTE